MANETSNGSDMDQKPAGQADPSFDRQRDGDQMVRDQEGDEDQQGQREGGAMFNRQDDQGDDLIENDETALDESQNGQSGMGMTSQGDIATGDGSDGATDDADNGADQ